MRRVRAHVCTFKSDLPFFLSDASDEAGGEQEKAGRGARTRAASKSVTGEEGRGVRAAGARRRSSPAGARNPDGDADGEQGDPTQGSRAEPGGRARRATRTEPRGGGQAAARDV